MSVWTGRSLNLHAAAAQPKGTDAATLRRIASAESGNSKQSSATLRRPWSTAVRPSSQRPAGVRGECTFLHSPGGFPPISTRESGHLLAAPCSNKRKDNLIIPHAGEFHPFNKLWGISVCTLRNLSVSVVYRIST